MKKLQSLKSFVVVFLILICSSCDNEPLEGEFLDDAAIVAEPGQFLCNKGTDPFEADTIDAKLFEDGSMTILATSADGDQVVLYFSPAGIGLFDLTSGSGVSNGAAYIEASNPTNPYLTDGANGGDGELLITEFDTDEMLVTGSFEFFGVRPALDEEGNPITESDGTPIYEVQEILNGSFREIPYTLEDETGGEVVNDFFAQVDNIDFIPTEVTVTREIVADIAVIKVVAVNENQESIRIDIPEELGVGTHSMENFTDGTQLIGIYNPGPGEENLTSNPGTINITQFSTQTGKITATFQFIGTDPLGQIPDTVEISEGSFTINYTPEPSEEPFSANVDGVGYVPDNIQIFDSFINEIEYVTIRTIDPAEQEIRISFPISITTGNYEFVPEAIDGTEVTASFAPDFVNNPTTFTSVSGTLSVASYDPETGEMEATFFFTATDPGGLDPTVYEITDGLFYLTL